MWKVLREQNEQIRSITQITHIQKLLQLHYWKSECFTKTNLEISETVHHIYAMDMPTANTFSLIMIMNAMTDNLPHVWDHITNVIVHSTTSNPYTPLMVHARLEMEQHLADSKSFLNPPLALTAFTRLTPFRKAGQKLCTNPKCPPE
jgi:hypothetical protein